MSHRKNLIVGLGVVLLTVLGSVSIAEAQGYPPPYYPPPPPPPPPHGVYRSGLVFGFSGGVGAIHTNNCGDACGVAGLLEGHIGGMINPRMALMFEIWGADHPFSAGGNSFETINTFFTGAAQYWVNDIVWIKGGLGVAEIREDINGGGYYGYTSNSSTRLRAVRRRWCRGDAVLQLRARHPAAHRQRVLQRQTAAASACRTTG